MEKEGEVKYSSQSKERLMAPSTSLFVRLSLRLGLGILVFFPASQPVIVCIADLLCQVCWKCVLQTCISLPQDLDQLDTILAVVSDPITYFVLLIIRTFSVYMG